MRTIIATLALLTLSMASRAGTLHVPSAYPTIQGAINAATANDTVLVAPGTYVENIDFKGKAITVTSSDGPNNTIIDGNQLGSVVVFDNGETKSSVLTGFTIRNGTGTVSPYGWKAGGGIYCDAASPTIRDNIVTGNSVHLSSQVPVAGGGIYCAGLASPLITGNVVHGNSIFSRGAGVGGGIACAVFSTATITDNTVFGNSSTGDGDFGGGGIGCHDHCKLTITRNVVHDNDTEFGGGIQINGDSIATIANNVVFKNTATEKGGGILCSYSSGPVLIKGNTVFGNAAASYGGGIHCVLDSKATVENTILWNNTAVNGPEIGVQDTSSLTIDFSDVKGGQSLAYVEALATLAWGAGMVSVDPLCANTGAGDFSLSAGSPCIDTGDPANGEICEVDLAGNPRLLDGLLTGQPRIDIGAHEFSNVRLAVSGSATPTGSLTIDATGTGGLFTYLFVGTQSGQTVLWPHGCLFLDLGAPYLLLPIGSLPISVTAVVPAGVPTPLDLVLQAVAVASGTGAGNASNGVELVIE